MSNMIIAAKNYIDDASSITADSEVATLPVENLQDLQIVKIYRSDGDTTVQIDVDWGSQKLVDFFALIAHNLSTGGQVRWRLSNDNFSTFVYDSGTVDAWQPVEDFGGSPWGVFTWGGLPTEADRSLYTANTFQLVDTPQLARYLRLDITDSINPDRYIQTGRLIAGPAYQPSVNYANGVEFEFIDDSRVTKSRGGQVFVDEIQKYRRIRFELIHLPEDEIFANVFNNIDRVKGISKDVLVIPQPDETSTWLTQNIYGRIASISPVRNTALNFYSRAVEIEEII
jgi:hypothetical protein